MLKISRLQIAAYVSVRISGGSSVSHAIKTLDTNPFVEQELGEVETDESGSAGDEGFSHGGVQYDKGICFVS